MTVGTGPSPSSSPPRGVLPRRGKLVYGAGAGGWSIVGRVVVSALASRRSPERPVEADRAADTGATS